MSFGNQGVAMMLFAERKTDETIAQAAVSRIVAFFETAHDGGHAHLSAFYEVQLTKARALVQRLHGP